MSSGLPGRRCCIQPRRPVHCSRSRPRRPTGGRSSLPKAAPPSSEALPGNRFGVQSRIPRVSGHNPSGPTHRAARLAPFSHPRGMAKNRWVFRKESAGRRLVPTIRRGLRSGRATSPPFGCAKTNQNAKLSRRPPQRPGMNRTREEQPGAHHPLHVRAPADPGPSDTPQCREDRQRPVRPKPGPGRGEHHPRGVITPRPQQPPQQLITPVTDRRGAARPTASGHKPDRTGAAVSSRLSRQRPSPAPCLPPSSNNEHPTSARNRECGPVTETDLMKRTVTADIDLDVTGPGRVVFQVAAVQAPGLEVDENLVLTLDGKPLSAREVVGVTGSRFHLVEPQPGKLLLSYTATVTGRADPPEVLDHELIDTCGPAGTPNRTSWP